MKKALAVPLLMLATRLAMAAPDVASTSKTGSVLVFPDVVSQTAHDPVLDTTVTSKTTIIRLVNNGSATAFVHCEYVDGERVGLGNGHAVHPGGGMVIPLKKNQAIWFDVTPAGTTTLGAQRYPQAGRGEGLLVCWAVDAADSTQVAWNHLSGTATVLDFLDGTAYEYKAWAFAALGPVGTPGLIEFDGFHYDWCPMALEGVSQYAAAPRLPDVAPGDEPGNQDRLKIAICRFDVRQAEGQEAITVLQFDYWLAGGFKVPALFEFADAWYATPVCPGACELHPYSYDGEFFRVQPWAQDVGIVAVQSRPATLPTAVGTTLTAIEPYEPCGTPCPPGPPNGFIKWNAADPVVAEGARR